MLVPNIGQGKVALEVLLERYKKSVPRLEVSIVEPLITKDIRLQWLAKLNSKKDKFQYLKLK